MTTITVAKASVQAGKGQASAPKEKKKGEGKQGEQPEIVAIESDEESEAELVIEEQGRRVIEQRAGTGPAVQSTSAITRDGRRRANIYGGRVRRGGKRSSNGDKYAYAGGVGDGSGEYPYA